DVSPAGTGYGDAQGNHLHAGAECGPLSGLEGNQRTSTDAEHEQETGKSRQDQQGSTPDEVPDYSICRL
ncbi:MAG TPA: hypothetical protein VEX40_02115, partial [Mycobacterium sp.]|nr:hypothetical protein [Mycobacterium sp.]